MRRLENAAWDLGLGPEGTDIAWGQGAVALRSNISDVAADGEDVDFRRGGREGVGHLNDL